MVNWWMAYFFSGFGGKLRTKHMKNYETFSGTALKSVTAKIPWELPEILLISKIPGGFWQIRWDFLASIFHIKAISLSLLECVGTLANSGGRYDVCVSDVCGTVANPTGNIRCYNKVTSTWPASKHK